jgi:hypothetical protein
MKVAVLGAAANAATLADPSAAPMKQLFFERLTAA